MAQYARELPVDKNNNPFPSTVPNFVANQAWSSVFTVSSTVGLNDRTTVLQIMTAGNGCNIKWGSGSVTGTTFDASVPANAVQIFVVPIQSFPSGGSVMGANGANGLYNSVSIKTIGGNTGSVFAVEY